MSNSNDMTNTNETLREQLDLALQAASLGTKQKKHADFSNAYAIIELHLSRSLPKGQVMKLFNDTYNHNLHPPQFRKMLDAERMRRAIAGDTAACPACGQPLLLDLRNAGGDELEDAA